MNMVIMSSNLGLFCVGVLLIDIFYMCFNVKLK